MTDKERRFTGLPEINPELAKRMKEKFGWDFPVLDKLENDDAFEVEPLSDEENTRRANRPLRYTGLPEIDSELSKRMKEKFGWDFPTSEEDSK